MSPAQFPSQPLDFRRARKVNNCVKQLSPLVSILSSRLAHKLAGKITLAACTGRRDGLRPVKLRTAEDLTDMVEDAILTLPKILRQDSQQHFGSR